MAAKQYQIYGSANYTATKPDHTNATPPNTFTTVEVTVAQLTEYITNLNNCVLLIAATTVDGIKLEITTQAAALLLGKIPPPPPPLSVGNPISDVFVNDSRPSGDAQVWRSGSGYAIHPVAAGGAATPAGSPIPIAVARLSTGVWMSACVVALKSSI